MDTNSNDKHTAEISHIVKGKVRVAVPLWLMFLDFAFCFGLLMVILSLILSAQRNVAYGASPNYQGVTVGPAVNHPQVHHRRIRLANSTESISNNSKTCGCGLADNQTQPALH